MTAVAETLPEQATCVADITGESQPQELIVAFASEDGDMVEQHFGSALGFFVYRITSEGSELIGSKAFGKEKKDGNEDKLKPKLAYLVGADMVYVASIGGSATKQLIALGITPVEVKGGPDVEDLVAELYGEMSGEPGVMLKRVLMQKAPKEDSRFDEMDDEEWSE